MPRMVHDDQMQPQSRILKMPHSVHMIGQTVGNRLIGLAFAATFVAGTIVLTARFAADARADDPSLLIVQGSAQVQPVETDDGPPQQSTRRFGQ